MIWFVLPLFYIAVEFINHIHTLHILILTMLIPNVFVILIKVSLCVLLISRVMPISKPLPFIIYFGSDVSLSTGKVLFLCI